MAKRPGSRVSCWLASMSCSRSPIISRARAELVEISRQGRAHRFRQYRHMFVTRMVEASDDSAARSFELRDLASGEGKPDELDRRRLALGAGVFPRGVRLTTDPFSCDIEKHVMLDP